MTVLRIERRPRYRSAIEKAIAKDRKLNPTSPSFDSEAIRTVLDNLMDPTDRDRQVVEFASPTSEIDGYRWICPTAECSLGSEPLLALCIEG